MSALEVTPGKVTLSALQSQRFEAVEAGVAATNVTWSLSPPSKGSIENDSGVYTSPRWIFVTRTVTVTAKSQNGVGTATVELTSLPSWTRFLGAYWIASVTGLLTVLFTLWSSLCPTCGSVEVVVSPPIVTLTSAQQQQFTASTPVNWGREVDGAGIYTAPQTVSGLEKLAVTATSTTNPKYSGSAVVFVSPDVGLSVYPASSQVKLGDTQHFTAVVSQAGTAAADVEWLHPAFGDLKATGALADFDTTGVPIGIPVAVLARTRGAAPRIAGAYVTVVPPDRKGAAKVDDCTANTASLLFLIFLMGAIGGLVHGISSFGIFVGNCKLLTSWVWWYFFKPVLGGLVALVVYLVFRAGFGGNPSLAGADCVTVAALAGLIGLFAEPATLKLRDIFDTLFTTRRDLRTGTLDSGKAHAPTIANLSPNPVKVTQASPPTITVTGSDFVQGCRASVASAPRDTRFVNDTTVEVKLKAADVAAARELPIVVYNDPPTGAASNAMNLKVVP